MIRTRLWLAVTGIFVVLVTVVVIITASATSSGAEVTAVVAGVLIAALMAAGQRMTGPVWGYLAAAVLLGLLAATTSSALVLVPTVDMVATAAGWDAPSRPAAAAIGSSLSVALLGASATDGFESAALPALLLPPAFAMGAHGLRQRSHSQTARPQLSKVLSRASTRLVQHRKPADVLREVLHTAHELWRCSDLPMTAAVLLDESLCEVFRSEDDGRITTDRCRGAEPPLTLQAAFADPGVVVVTGDKAEQVSDHIGVAGGLDNVVMAPLTKQDENLWMLVVQTPADLPEELRYAVDALADMGGIAIAAAQCSDDLEMSDAQFKALVEDSADVIMVLDMDATVGYVSPSLQSAGGYKPEEIAGTSLTRRLHPEDAKTLPHYLARSVPPQSGWASERRVRLNPIADPATGTGRQPPCATSSPADPGRHLSPQSRGRGPNGWPHADLSPEAFAGYGGRGSQPFWC